MHAVGSVGLEQVEEERRYTRQFRARTLQSLDRIGEGRLFGVVDYRIYFGTGLGDSRIEGRCILLNRNPVERRGLVRGIPIFEKSILLRRLAARKCCKCHKSK